MHREILRHGGSAAAAGPSGDAMAAHLAAGRQARAEAAAWLFGLLLAALRRPGRQAARQAASGGLACRI